MISLEQLFEHSPAARNFDLLKRLVIDTGGQIVGIRFGTATVTWAGGTTDASVTVTHGLGTTPAVVFTQSGTIIAHARPATIGATTFQASARTVDGSLPGAGTQATVYWLVVG